MNQRPVSYSFPLALLALQLTCGSQLAGQVLFSSDFETESVGATTATDPSGIVGLRPAFAGATIADDTTAVPFGPDNQFVIFQGASARVPVHTTAVPPAAYLASAVMVAFDLYEPDGFAGRTLMGLGSGLYVPEVNMQSELFALELNNGFLAGGFRTTNVSGSLPILAVDEPYRLFMVMNLAAESMAYTDPQGNAATVATNQMDVWIYDYTTGQFRPGGKWATNQTAINDTIGFTFRHFSTDLNRIYFDNLLISSNVDWTVRGSGQTEEPDSWHGYALDATGWVNTGAWLGPVYVANDPWVYSADLQQWLLLPPTIDTSSGAWLFVPRAGGGQ
jgi:hypothetical protein